MTDLSDLASLAQHAFSLDGQARRKVPAASGPRMVATLLMRCSISRGQNFKFLDVIEAGRDIKKNGKKKWQRIGLFQKLISLSGTRPAP